MKAYREGGKALLRERGAENPRVFGSVALGTDDLLSAVDILVSLAPERAWEFVTLARELSDLLGVQEDVLSDRGLKSKQAELVEEAVPL